MSEFHPNISGSAMGKGPALPAGYNTVSAFGRSVSIDFEEGNELSNITDRFFEYIEKQEEHLTQYRTIEEVLGTHQLNAQIGRWIKEHYDLENGPVVKATLSTLIDSYTTHFRK